MIRVAGGVLSLSRKQEREFSPLVRTAFRFA